MTTEKDETTELDEMHPEDRDWNQLVKIFCDVYRVLPHELVSKRKHPQFSTPRHLLAAIWSDGRRIADTQERLYYRSAANIAYAKSRLQQIAGGPDCLTKARLDEVMRRIILEIPHVVGIYDQEND
jgi:hypothetical protein